MQFSQQALPEKSTLEMADRKLLVSERLSLKDLQDAGSELVDYGVRVSKWGYDRTQELNPALSPYSQPVMIRNVVNSVNLAGELRRSWRRADFSVSRLLVAIHVMAYPPTLVDQAPSLVSGTPPLNPPPLSYRDTVASFFEDKFRQFKTLELEDIQNQLGTINWLTLTYTRTQFLKAAIHHGAFLIENS